MLSSHRWAAALGRYEDKEFPAEKREQTMSYDNQVRLRKMNTVWQHFANDAQFVQLNLFAAATVFTIGFAEAFLLLVSLSSKVFVMCLLVEWIQLYSLDVGLVAAPFFVKISTALYDA